MKLRFLSVQVLLFALNASAFAADVDPRHASVSCFSLSNKEQVLCDYRVSKSLKVENVGVKLSGKPIQLKAESFSPYPAENQTTAILFLIDTSDPGRKNTIERRVVSDLFDILSSPSAKKDHVKYSISTFDTEIKIQSPFGASYAETLNSLANIKADGMATEFYKSILAAIKQLNSFDATRKALIILSDGKDEDRAYKHEDVLKAAKEANVVIMGLGYAEKKSDYPHLQTLQRLSEETHGFFVNVTDKSSFNSIVQQPFLFIEKGGRLAIPSAGYYGNEILTLELGIDDGKSIAINTRVNISDNRSFIEKTIVYTKKYWLYIFLVLSISSLSGFFVYKLQRKFFNKSPQVVQYACLSEANAMGSKYPINKTAIRIGRGGDNDICLPNDSISSHHAEIHMRRDRSFFIVDLNSTNGVLINGKKVTQQELQDGDLIEIGEVRLNFNRT
jgi:uncharacterized protein YegL